MIERVGSDEGLFIFVCDDCGEGSDEYSSDEFRTAVEEIKSEGWRITKERGEWVHLCPDCR